MSYTADATTESAVFYVDGTSFVSSHLTCTQQCFPSMFSVIDCLVGIKLKTKLITYLRMCTFRLLFLFSE